MSRVPQSSSTCTPRATITSFRSKQNIVLNVEDGVLIPVARSAKPLPARQGQVCAYTTFTQREAHNPEHIVIEIIHGTAERKRENRERGGEGKGGG